MQTEGHGAEQRYRPQFSSQGGAGMGLQAVNPVQSPSEGRLHGRPALSSPITLVTLQVPGADWGQ